MTVRSPFIDEWILQWNAYVPAVAGAVDRDGLAGGDVDVERPVVRGEGVLGRSLFSTLNVEPAVTGWASNAKPWMVTATAPLL